MPTTVKDCWSKWYGKVALACITVAAVMLTGYLLTWPYNDRAAGLARLSQVEKEVTTAKTQFHDQITEIQVEWNARIARIETNIDWLVRKEGGNPTAISRGDQ